MNELNNTFQPIRIDVMANGYAVYDPYDQRTNRIAGPLDTHVFESFEALVAYLRNRLPIYPAFFINPVQPTPRKR